MEVMDMGFLQKSWREDKFGALQIPSPAVLALPWASGLRGTPRTLWLGASPYTRMSKKAMDHLLDFSIYFLHPIVFLKASFFLSSEKPGLN